MAHVHSFNSDASEVYTCPFFPDGGVAALSGAGAIDPDESHTKWTTTGANAGTLADGTAEGQTIVVTLVVDGGDGTLTPASFHDGTTVTFADVGDTVILQWRTIGGTTAWKLVFSLNLADGVTAPAVA